MFASQQDDNQPIKNWLPYVLGMAATAMLSALGSSLIEWGVEELKKKYGSKEPEKKEDE